MTRTQTPTALTMTRRLRRLRRTAAMRALVRETRLSADMFMLPLFVCEGEGVRREVTSMPGVFNLSVDEAVKETAAAKADGVKSVILFGIPDRKDDIGSLAYDPGAPVQSAVLAIKREVPGVLVATDVCLCEYTDHGHCGIVIDEEIANDATVDQLVRAAISHAAAGADIVAFPVVLSPKRRVEGPIDVHTVFASMSIGGGPRSIAVWHPAANPIAIF